MTAIMDKTVQTSQLPSRGSSGFISPRRFFSRFFSPRIEDSLRLRVLALAALWLAATSLIWVGGGLILPVLGAGIGTLGYWAGWRWRNKKSLAKSLVIASVIIGLSFYMRPQMLEVLTGNWMPLGQFLILCRPSPASIHGPGEVSIQGLSSAALFCFSPASRLLSPVSASS